jgi:hypothetical protein
MGGSSHTLSPAPAAEAGTPQLEVDQLRHELARERALVERLRRSKLDIERRAAEAEAQLGRGAKGAARGGLLGRFFTRAGERPE